MPNKEQITNGWQTTLAQPMDASVVTCTVTSALGAPATGQMRLKVDNEVMIATRTGVTTVLDVLRGQEGTTATSHVAGAAVKQVLTAGALGQLVSVYDDGVLIQTTRELDFQGAGVVVTEDGGTATITVGGGGGGSGHTIEEDASPLTSRTGLNFGDGLVATDNPGADRTDVAAAYGTTAEIADVAATEAEGTSPKVPRADHRHAHGSGYLPNAHHNQAHELTGADHALSGLTTGDVLKATSATTAAFQDPAHASTHGASAADAITADLDANARVGIRRNSGVTTLKRRKINLLEGAGVSISATDDATDEEIDVRIALSGGVGAAVCASVSNSGAISLTNNTPTVLAFDTEAVDTTGFHSTSSNTGRLTIPSGQAGKYLASGAVSFAANGTGVRRVEVLKNGTTTVAEVQVAAVAGVSTVLTITTPPLDLAETDYLELRAYQNSGGALNVEASGYSPTFGLTLLATVSAGGGGHTVQDDGVASSARTYLNFREGLAVTDDAGADTTHVDLDIGTGATQAAAGNHTHAYADHGSLSGLADDDHSQYLLASGATSRAAFGTNWTDLTDGGATTLHSHAASGYTDPLTTRGDLLRRGAVATERYAIGTAGKVLASDGTDPVWADQYATINFVIDGGGSAITTGIKGDVVVDFAATIVGATTLADQSGSIVVDIWKDSYANYPPTDADSITAAAPPTLSSAAKAQDTTLTSWTTSISAGSVLRFNVDSCATITRCTIALKVRRD